MLDSQNFELWRMPPSRTSPPTRIPRRRILEDRRRNGSTIWSHRRARKRRRSTSTPTSGWSWRPRDICDGVDLPTVEDVKTSSRGDGGPRTVDMRRAFNAGTAVLRDPIWDGIARSAHFYTSATTLGSTGAQDLFFKPDRRIPPPLPPPPLPPLSPSHRTQITQCPSQESRALILLPQAQPPQTEPAAPKGPGSRS